MINVILTCRQNICFFGLLLWLQMAEVGAARW